MGPQLTPVLAALIVGAVAGSLVERWLIWRRLTDARWAYRRLTWAGRRERAAQDEAAQFAALATILQLRNPLLIALWLVREQRALIALLCLAVLGAAGVAIYLK